MSWRQLLAADTDAELIAALNQEVGNSGWVELRGYYLTVLRNELDRRHFDYSAVDGLMAFPGRRRFALAGKQLVYSDDSAIPLYRNTLSDGTE